MPARIPLAPIQAAILVVLCTVGAASAQPLPGQALAGPTAPAARPAQDPPGSPEQARPQPPPWMIPRYRLLREEEDWSYLADETMRRHWLDPLKYIRLGARPDWYLTIGAQTRQWYEYYRNENWGQTPYETNGYLMQRYMVHGDLHFGNRIRAFAQLKSGIVSWRAGGPRPVVDNNRLDINQAFLDVGFGRDQRDRPTATLRLGRQEMHFGTGRLVSVREGPNVRAGFDGARVIVNSRGWRIDTFLTRPVLTSEGFFDDRADPGQRFWGTFATGPLRSAPLGLDVYYFGLNRKVGVFDQGIGPQTRHTIGSRISKGGIPFTVGRGLDYDVEYAYQFGTFGPARSPRYFGAPPPGRIRAWTISSQTGYTLENIRLQPRFGVSTGITSGDKDPLDPDLQTFFTPFPNGRFFGAIQQNGPLNIQGFRPSVTVQLPRRATLTADAFFFWRQSVSDGLYNIPGFPLRPGHLSRARYIGTQPGLGLFWPLTSHTTLDLNYAYFAAGRFLQESPPGRNLHYVGLILNYRF